MTSDRPEEVSLCFRANIKYLAWVHSLFDRVAEDCGFDLQRKHRLLVAVSEAFTNAVLHGSGQKDNKSIEVNITQDEAWLKIEIIDEESTLSSIPPESAWGQVSPHSEGGRGLELMRGLTDKLQFRETPTGGLIVSLQYNVPPAPINVGRV